MKKLHVFVLLILPALLVFTAAILHYAHGPYWIGSNSDPEYVFLINSLALAEHKETPTQGHPSTTVQMLGAATLIISHTLDFSEKDTLELSVLKNPEFYLTVINIILISLNVLMLFIIGLVTYILTKNIWLGLLLQFSPFLSDVLLIEGLPRISPEPLLLFAGLLFLCIMVKMIFSENISKSAHRYMICLALISGFGMATKLTFAPLMIIPLFVLPELRNKIWFLFLAGLSFVLWTWPIIPQYATLFNWYLRVLTHTGYYGLGSPGIINPEIYFQSMRIIFLHEPLFFLIWIFSACFIVFVLLRGDRATRKTVWQDTSFRILVAVVVAQLCSILLVAKHPPSRNLLPALSLSGFTLFLIFIYLQRIKYFSHLNIKKVVIFVSIFFILSSTLRINSIKSVFMQNLQIKQEQLFVYNTLENKYKNHLKIAYYFPLFRPSSPAFALAWGNFFIGNGMYSESLQKIYGEAYFYNGVTGKFNTWTKEFSIEDIILKGHGDKIILYGRPLNDFGNKIVCVTDSNMYSWKRGWSIENFANGDYDKMPSRTGSILYLKDVLGGKTETIYVLDGILFNDYSHQKN